MANEKGSNELQMPMVFVKHGDPLPGEWMARHPGWVKFPATLVQRGGSPVRANRVDGSGLPSTGPAVLAAGMARPASAGAPVSPGRFGRRPGSRPPAHPQGADKLARSATWGGEDPVDAYLRVKAAMDQVIAQAATGPDAGAAAQSRLEDARERAFLRLLRWLENGDVPDDVAYHARFGGHDPMRDDEMTNYIPKDELYKHRKKVNDHIVVVDDKNSSGGAYQINRETWHDAQVHLGVKNFTPAD